MQQGLRALAGGVGTWYFNLQPMAGGYLVGWFANPAASSAAVDLVALAGRDFLLVESRRVGMRFAGVSVPLSFVIAFTFPLFLAWREHHLVPGRPHPILLDSVSVSWKRMRSGRQG